MANKKSKKSTQASPASETAEAKKVASKKAQAKKAVASKKDANVKKASAAKKTTKDKKNAKPGALARTKKYFAQVRSEMKRVVWPSKKELINYSVTVVVSLIAVGVVIAVLDSVISGGLVLFSGLRG